MTATHSFSSLIPDVILDAVESTGLWSDSRIYPLNSYENRVYQIGIEDASPVIAKFYRPERWNERQIREEHQTLLQLHAAGVPVVAPIKFNGESLLRHKGMYFCLSPRLIGQHPEADNLDQLYQIGELIGQLHSNIQTTPFQDRISVSPLSQMDDAANQILTGRTLFGHAELTKALQLPEKLKPIYKKQIQTLRDQCEASIKSYWPTQLRPIHGDCHRSNLMLHDGQFHLVDFDDCQNGVAVQDLWLHITQTENPRQQLSEIIEGYETYLPFETRELDLVDVFKCVRVISYAAWLQSRWHDPAFTKAFTWFGSEDYWINHLNELKKCELEWGQISR
ncbi:serine/threonine protein kinase [Marinomonas rhizomae]|uniref:Stress response kinase A n=1 Tax=Marinomonas rhizomae TaxID=491948 RepID=A0A366JGJ8_9GAMM|nr:serine/threonine protein kinase [Marinomonas rhizomae]RBP85600.1 Ser/Thr protein kinase RdoA (MazF antagonist) [Marinomonas rhizomae]RNF75771.1 serine/threonine protein kinase [Marinomonas rhizomae]